MRGEKKEERSFLVLFLRTFFSVENLRIRVSVSEVCSDNSWVTCLLLNTPKWEFDALWQSKPSVKLPRLKPLWFVSYRFGAPVCRNGRFNCGFVGQEVTVNG